MIENYVTSFVDGRIRFRHPILKDSQIVEQIGELLQNVPGVVSLKHNERTGSLLLEYDQDTLDKETLLNLMQQGEQFIDFESLDVQAKKPLCCLPSKLKSMTTREKRKMYNRTMAVALGISALAIGVGNERVHALTGIVFLGLSLGHIKRMHKALM